jgi:L,D-transpeptidase YcbB
MRVLEWRAVSRLAALFALLLIPACRTPRPTPPPGPVEITRAALESRIGPAGTKGPVYCRSDRVCGSDVLPGFYRGRGFRPAWIDDGLSLASASAFVGALRLVAGDGLNPENYHLATLEKLIGEIRTPGEKPGPAGSEALADLEMLLTDSFLLCGSHLVHGQVNPETVESEWFIKSRAEDLAVALEKGLAAGDVAGALDSLRPQNSVYKGLKEAFRIYGEGAGRRGWPPFPPGPKLKKKDRNTRVEALRNCLEALGDLDPPKGGDRLAFDRGLEDALKAFQRRHGLEPDGVVGASTEAALNVRADARLAQIRANLERWRWISPDLGARHILVNVADFRVDVVEDGRKVLSMPAIVGTDYKRTPEFSGMLSAIELNPAWNIPQTIAAEEILPKLKKNPRYLADVGIRAFKGWSANSPEIDAYVIDWSKYEPGRLPFRFRQDPGPENPLGRFKFLFPNKFDVYLHDTSTPWLFARAIRNFSHGCVRIERPLDLAEFLLREDPVWNREKLMEALEDLTTRVIRVRKPIAVHVLYWTAWLGDDGKMQFREDIYSRDAAIVRALEERASAPVD